MNELVCGFFEFVARPLVGLYVQIRSKVMNSFSVSVRSCFLRSLGEDSDRMCYAVVQAAAFCQAALFYVFEVDQLPDVHNIEA